MKKKSQIINANNKYNLKMIIRENKSIKVYPNFNNFEILEKMSIYNNISYHNNICSVNVNQNHDI